MFQGVIPTIGNGFESVRLSQVVRGTLVDLYESLIKTLEMSSTAAILNAGRFHLNALRAYFPLNNSTIPCRFD